MADYDRSVRMFDEGYPPEVLDEMTKNKTLHDRSFLQD